MAGPTGAENPRHFRVDNTHFRIAKLEKRHPLGALLNIGKVTAGRLHSAGMHTRGGLERRRPVWVCSGCVGLFGVCGSNQVPVCGLARHALHLEARDAAPATTRRTAVNCP